MANPLYVGIDIGGSLTKVAILSGKKIDLQCTKVHLKGNEFYLHSSKFQKVLDCIEWIKAISLGYDKIIFGATGGGAVKYDEILKENFPSVSITMYNQFESNVKGIQFIKQTQIPINIHQFSKAQEVIQTKTLENSKFTDNLFPIIFVSYGSGANFHKIAIGSDGLQREKVDIDLSIDGYMLDGTCLGAGYIYGLISALSGRPSKEVGFLIRQNKEYNKIGSTLLSNSLQTAITLSDIHKAETIMPIGSILSVLNTQECFKTAFSSIISPIEHRKNLIQVSNAPGALGAIGVLYTAMLGSK